VTLTSTSHLSSLSSLSPRPTIDDGRDDATAITQARTPRVKELVERVSGVPAATQRLLCRGRVLSDDASMESARVEDGAVSYTHLTLPTIYSV